MKLSRMDYLWVTSQIVLFGAYLVPLYLPFEIPSLMLWPTQLIILLGLLEIAWALVQMGRFLSPFPKPRQESKLITGGVFAIVRHPIYSGIFLIAAGYGFYSESLYRVLMAFVLLLFFYLKSLYEERNLKVFFQDYKAYAEQTGRFFPKLFGTKP